MQVSESLRKGWHLGRASEELPWSCSGALVVQRSRTAESLLSGVWFPLPPVANEQLGVRSRQAICPCACHTVICS